MKSYLISLVVIILFFSCDTKKKTDKINLQKYIVLLDSSVIENSGLLLWDDRFWTFNDSGGKNELYGLDKQTGAVINTIQLSNVNNVDWEEHVFHPK